MAVYQIENYILTPTYIILICILPFRDSPDILIV